MLGEDGNGDTATVGEDRVAAEVLDGSDVARAHPVSVASIVKRTRYLAAEPVERSGITVITPD